MSISTIDVVAGCTKSCRDSSGKGYGLLSAAAVRGTFCGRGSFVESTKDGAGDVVVGIALAIACAAGSGPDEEVGGVIAADGIEVCVTPGPIISVSKALKACGKAAD